MNFLQNLNRNFNTFDRNVKFEKQIESKSRPGSDKKARGRWKPSKNQWKPVAEENQVKTNENQWQMKTKWEVNPMKRRGRCQMGKEEMSYGTDAKLAFDWGIVGE